ncbi:hypothetical protein KFK09_024291 [Dendrobium nobile]|uniref:Uncharacterized protein n=1 Tax=Dendrobium nobile TaxID=94219 RepID=A0A8T3ADC3_DENNO|nr:hypothetical protein KFK09_024291 [Dendrobium nobile]
MEGHSALGVSDAWRSDGLRPGLAQETERVRPRRLFELRQREAERGREGVRRPGLKGEEADLLRLGCTNQREGGGFSK